MKYTSSLFAFLMVLQSFGQAKQESIYEQRNRLTRKADSLMMADFYSPVYIATLKKIAATDTDTFLVAAQSYGKIKSAFFNDSTLAKLAAESELYCINKSLVKYPDNFDAYVYRLSLYKFSPNKDGEDILIKTFQQKFSSRWEMHFVMADHYIYYDFLWPDTKEFDLCSNYLKKAVELNPSDFNSLLLLSVAYEKNKTERIAYLKKMYALAPKQFSKNTALNQKTIPFVVKSIRSPLLTRDLTVVITTEESKLLNLK